MKVVLALLFLVAVCNCANTCHYCFADKKIKSCGLNENRPLFTKLKNITKFAKELASLNLSIESKKVEGTNLNKEIEKNEEYCTKCCQYKNGKCEGASGLTCTFTSWETSVQESFDQMAVPIKNLPFFFLEKAIQLRNQIS